MNDEHKTLLADVAAVKYGDFIPDGDTDLINRILQSDNALVILRALEIAYALGYKTAAVNLTDRATGFVMQADARLALIRDSLKD